jgi:hypothetical protein
MTITGDSIEDFNFTHEDPWTFDFVYQHPFATYNFDNTTNWIGMCMSDPDTHNGWGFSVNEYGFYWWSNDPTNSRLEAFHWDTGEDSTGDHMVSDLYYPYDSAGGDGQRAKFYQHFALVNEPGVGLSFYGYRGDSDGIGERLAGPFPIHITANSSTSTVYWGGIERLTNVSDQIWDSAGQLVQSSAGDNDPNPLPSIYTLIDTGNSIGEDVGWGSRHARSSHLIQEVRVSNVARYSGDTYDHPGHSFVNDDNTTFLFHPIPTRIDSAGDYAGLGQPYNNGEVIQDSGVIIGGDDNGTSTFD